MPTTCIVLGCGSRSNRDPVRFYRIPAVRAFRFQTHINELTSRRRDRWLAAIKRSDLTETKIQYQMVCSRHFITGKPAALDDINNPDWVPSQHMGYLGSISTKRTQKDVYRKQQQEKRSRKEAHSKAFDEEAIVVDDTSHRSDRTLQHLD